jgi:uncharacterized protein
LYVGGKMIQKLKPKIEKYFEGFISHDFSHTERVYNLAIKIAEKENADMDIVQAAALLHDVGRFRETDDNKKCHAEESADMAPEILRNINFPENKIAAVLHCIKVHRYSKGLKAETKEAEIVQDADRLEAIGAIAIARVFAGGGVMKRPIYNPNIKPKEKYDTDSETSMNHFYEKLLKIKPETFRTKAAKEIAKERYKFMEEYIEHFHKEWAGEI